MFGIVTQVAHVEGMHCGHCAARVEKALGALAGVRSVKVDLEKKIATIKVKPALKEEDVKKAIDETGFTFAGLE